MGKPVTVVHALPGTASVRVILVMVGELTAVLPSATHSVKPLSANTRLEMVVEEVVPVQVRP